MGVYVDIFDFPWESALLFVKLTGIYNYLKTNSSNLLQAKFIYSFISISCKPICSKLSFTGISAKSVFSTVLMSTIILAFSA